jgi:hypothetical protein
VSITPTDMDDFRCLRALKTSKSEIGAKDKNSEDDRKMGETFV